MMLFELFYVSFGQAIASFSPSELLASLLVPVFFTFVTIFSGIVVPYPAMPTFWRSWMYHLAPFTYLVQSFLGLIAHNVPVQCEPSELAQFSPPPGQTCEQYANPYIRQAGGYVETLSNGMCGFCQYASGDQYVSSPTVLAIQSLTEAGCGIQCILQGRLERLRFSM